MAEYKINKEKNEILFEGISFNLQEIKAMLKQQNVELYKAVACPGEIKYTLSREAIFILRQLKEEKC